MNNPEQNTIIQKQKLRQQQIYDEIRTELDNRNRKRLKLPMINDKSIYFNDANTGLHSISANIVNNEKNSQNSITTLLFQQNLMELQKKHSIMFFHDGK